MERNIVLNPEIIFFAKNIEEDVDLSIYFNLYANYDYDHVNYLYLDFAAQRIIQFEAM